MFSNCHFNTMMAGSGVWAMDSFHMKLQYSLIIGIQWCNDETNGIEIKFIYIPTKAVTFLSLQIYIILTTNITYAQIYIDIISCINKYDWKACCSW